MDAILGNQAEGANDEQDPGEPKGVAVNRPPRRLRLDSSRAIRPGQYGCAARDSNPEPAD
jgi:hypothetical protein